MIEFSLQTDGPIHFACAQIEAMTVQQDLTAFDHIAEIAEKYADEFQWTPLSEIPGVQNARRFFRAIGIDPTKRRPSSEALLNRAVKRKELYSVNTLVDVGNWCSLEFLLPTCVYDAEKIQGDVAIRLGRTGERYEALNHREMDFKDRLILADEKGPFGSPMTDSLRTATNVETTNCVIGIWAPADYDRIVLQDHIDLFARRTCDICGGAVENVHVLSA